MVYTSVKHLYQPILFLCYHTNALYHTVPDITAVDYPDHRGEIVYNLLSTIYNNRLRVKTFPHSLRGAPSVTSIYAGSG